MKFRHKALIIFAMGHIGLVMLGATGMTVLADTANQLPLVAWYQQLTGADNSFAFFAPEVGPEERVTFILADASDHHWADDLNLAQKP